MAVDISRIGRIISVTAIAATLISSAHPARGDDAEDLTRIRRAVDYLDARQDAWSRFAKAERGQGEDKTSCVSCHTGLSYALARPILRRFLEANEPSRPERRMIEQVRLRLDHWAELDSPELRLMYDSNERKKTESRGTEAVINALLLANDDAARRATTPSTALRSAFRQLWATQATSGSSAGSWDWLNFGLEPWEANGSRPFGAAVAAIAAGLSPGYMELKLDDGSARGVELLRDYLLRRFPQENLYNRLWILEASARLEGILTPDQKKEVVDQLLAIQQPDGGWALASMGAFERVDGTEEPRESDGYATGLAVHVLNRVAAPVEPSRRDKGIAWLRSHQRADGSWVGRSLNKERDPSTFVGMLMTDAATAFAAMAIAETRE